MVRVVKGWTLSDYPILSQTCRDAQVTTCRYIRVLSRLFARTFTYMYACTTGMTFAKGRLVFELVLQTHDGEANSDQLRVRDKERRPIENRERTQENMKGGKGEYSGVELIINKISYSPDKNVQSRII